jgi:tRNA(Arg) A34 adenosine deaminase TadA
MQSITAAQNYLGGKYLKDCTLYVTLEPCHAQVLCIESDLEDCFGATDEQRGLKNGEHNCILKQLLFAASHTKLIYETLFVDRRKSKSGRKMFYKFNYLNIRK